MIPNLIFHLGDRKCGSTSIQHTLGQGLWHSDQGTLAYMAKDHNGPLAQSLVDMSDTGLAERRFANLAQRLGRVTADVAVVSAETFEDVAPKALAAMIEAHLPEYRNSLRLIAYVRLHAGRILSGFAEQIKRGQSLSDLAGFFAEGVFLERFTCFERFKSWKDTFGDQFELRVMDRTLLKDACVVRDFIDYALGGVEFSLEGQVDANPSLCLEDLAVLREMHRIMAAAPARSSALGAQLGSILSGMARVQSSRLMFPQALVQDTIDLCLTDAQSLDDGFFDGTPMADALMSLSAQAVADMASVRIEDHYSVDQIRMIQSLIKIMQKQ